MRSSITIATIFGTKVRMHLTFLLLLVWVAAGEAASRGGEAAVGGVVFVLLLFVCVVAHEFGHILVAQRYGGRTRDILLLPIGGVSRMERMPESPSQELAVALAGPAVSIAIGLALVAVGGFPTSQSISNPAVATLLPRLAATNLFLAIFNLLPAFPMDGGRALRALLALRMGRMAATRTAAWMGHIFAGLFVLLGLLSGNPLLLLIGIFVYFGASAESAGSQLRQLAQTLKVSDVMRSNVLPISDRASLNDAIALMIQAGQHAIPVVGDDGNVKGLATKEGIIRAVHRSGRRAPVSDAAERDVPKIGRQRPLAEALDLMQSQSAPAILVTGPEGELAGVLTADTLADLVLVGGATEWREQSNMGRSYPHGSSGVPRTA
jgi:stage IV sporulation protein FB